MADPLTPEEIADIRSRVERLRAARLPLGAGDILDERFLATLDAARAAAPVDVKRLDEDRLIRAFTSSGLAQLHEDTWYIHDYDWPAIAAEYARLSSTTGAGHETPRPGAPE